MTMSMLRPVLLLHLVAASVAFAPPSRRTFRPAMLLKSSDWSDFSALDDDDDFAPIDTTDYAKEEDSQEAKAAVGSTRPAPTIENDAEPIFVPVGSALDLTEENVLGLLAACREEIGTMFGYTEENRGVGITGGVDFVDFDGPSIILKLKGRFWHERKTVLARVGAYLRGRIPEIVDVLVEDEYQLTDEANEKWS
eukprot:CAMPEP_0119004310 /NCGR_PEP_ID=MMETSP1176-20130426/1070_1 /TAXON_ID=265551 /ORGANISM="Synedropsis recta cf, Strain CCMP1620" /LENGTH=194 /DNA_ID=CAMNT_0006956001 /DNA_START=9 /DNA_END=593 /DNA_ORIENTATION=+